MRVLAIILAVCVVICPSLVSASGKDDCLSVSKFKQLKWKLISGRDGGYYRPIRSSDIPDGGLAVRNQDVLVIGDLHGDLRKFLKTLYAAGYIDKKINWTAGRKVLVQLGDVIDRGDYPVHIWAVLLHLHRQARAQGGHVVMLFGNHEGLLMEVMIAARILTHFSVPNPDVFSLFIDNGLSRNKTTNTILGLYQYFFDSTATKFDMDQIDHLLPLFAPPKNKFLTGRYAYDLKSVVRSFFFNGPNDIGKIFFELLRNDGFCLKSVIKNFTLPTSKDRRGMLYDLVQLWKKTYRIGDIYFAHAAISNENIGRIRNGKLNIINAQWRNLLLNVVHRLTDGLMPDPQHIMLFSDLIRPWPNEMSNLWGMITPDYQSFRFEAVVKKMATRPRFFDSARKAGMRTLVFGHHHDVRTAIIRKKNTPGHVIKAHTLDMSADHYDQYGGVLFKPGGDTFHLVDVDNGVLPTAYTKIPDYLP